MKRRKPEVDKQIADIIQKHIGFDPAVKLFGALSKVGGNVFQEKMRRVRDVAQSRKNSP
jgi:hypothetical protein